MVLTLSGTHISGVPRLDPRTPATFELPATLPSRAKRRSPQARHRLRLTDRKEQGSSAEPRPARNRLINDLGVCQPAPLVKVSMSK